MLRPSRHAIAAGGTKASFGISSKRRTTGKCLAKSFSRISGEFSLYGVAPSDKSRSAVNHARAKTSMWIFDAPAPKFPRGKIPIELGVPDLASVSRALEAPCPYAALRVSLTSTTLARLAIGFPILAQKSDHACMSRRRFSKRSPRRYAASTLLEIACARAISATSRG